MKTEQTCLLWTCCQFLNSKALNSIHSLFNQHCQTSETRWSTLSYCNHHKRTLSCLQSSFRCIPPIYLCWQCLDPFLANLSILYFGFGHSNGPKYTTQARKNIPNLKSKGQQGSFSTVKPDELWKWPLTSTYYRNKEFVDPYPRDLHFVPRAKASPNFHI